MSQLAHKPLNFYPAYCYSASPTYFLWVKLTAHDIHHHLRTRGEQHQSSTGNPLYFYLNHPIQFVQVVGVVVAIEEYHPHIFLFTLDDSSGSTIDVVWRKPKLERLERTNGTTATAATEASMISTESPSVATDSLLPLLPSLHIGSLIVAKGTLSQFRGTLQLTLLRGTILTPNQELQLISSRTTFLLSTLSVPWNLSRTKQAKLLARATGNVSKESERTVQARKRREHRERREKMDAEEIERQWGEEEKVRAEEGQRMKKEGELVKKMIEERRTDDKDDDEKAKSAIDSETGKRRRKASRVDGGGVPRL